MNRNLSKSFTLIELIVVVTIIGILSGVLLTIIQPEMHRKRAKDSASFSMMEKLILAAQTYRSATGDYPLCQNFLRTVSDSVYYEDYLPVLYRCVDSTDENVHFAIKGIDLPSTCNSSYAWGQGGSEQCFFHYNGNWTSGGEDAAPHFYVRKWEKSGNNDEYWCWNPLYGDGTIQSSCDRTCGQLSPDPANPTCN